jgi:hypothetical protein
MGRLWDGPRRMTEPPADSWQTGFFIAAAILILLQAARGWRLGIVRQVAQIVALGGAYVAAWIGGAKVAPYLEPLGLAYPVLVALGGAAIFAIVFIVISGLSAVLFKKTGDQSVGMVKLGYGLSGAAVGGLFGLFIVWIAILAIRVLGTIAETEAEAVKRLQAGRSESAGDGGMPNPNPLVRGLAELKQSLGQGTTGAVVEQIDPIPGAVYRVIEKVGTMVGNEKSLTRFMDYPGVKPLAEHPKIVALQRDPQIARQVSEKNIFALMRNPNVVAVANDQEVMNLMRDFEFEKALDYAVGKPEKPSPAPPAH